MARLMTANRTRYGTQVVDLIGYVYCPRFDKRDYLMQVDGICRSIKWNKGE